MKIIKKSLGLVLMLGLAIGGIALTGCKKKTSENITTQKTTTKKEYSFNDVWKVSDSEQSKYEAVIKSEADSTNLLTSNTINLTARKKVKIKKISYTAKNTSESDVIILIPINNGNHLNSNDMWSIATYDSDSDKKEFSLSKNSTKDVSMTYDNFVVEKGKVFLMGFMKKDSSPINFYNFVIEFEVIE